LKRKKLLVTLFALAAALLLSWFLSPKSARSGTEYLVYFEPRDGVFDRMALGGEKHTIPADAEPAEELLRLLVAGPSDTTLHGLIPPETQVRARTLEKGVLTVDFSGEYAALSGIDRTLADLSIGKTLAQLPGVDSVRTTVMGDPLLEEAEDS
jgi:germination protein M